MSLYSRYSESSISVSYFSRSSALICSAVLLRLIRPAQPVGRGGFHLSPPIVGVLTRWVRSAIDYARLPGPPRAVPARIVTRRPVLPEPVATRRTLMKEYRCCEHGP